MSTESAWSVARSAPPSALEPAVTAGADPTMSGSAVTSPAAKSPIRRCLAWLAALDQGDETVRDRCPVQETVVARRLVRPGNPGPGGKEVANVSTISLIEGNLGNSGQAW